MFSSSREANHGYGPFGTLAACGVVADASCRRHEPRRAPTRCATAAHDHALDPLAHDEVYYVTNGEGVVVSDGVEARLAPGMAAYPHKGAVVAIRHVGDQPLSIVIAYPVEPKPPQR